MKQDLIDFFPFLAQCELFLETINYGFKITYNNVTTTWFYLDQFVALYKMNNSNTTTQSE